MVANVIIVSLMAFLFICAYMFGPKKTILTAYYALKYALFKPVEWLLRLFIAMVRIDCRIWIVWVATVLFLISFLSNQDVRFALFILAMLLSQLILLLMIRNFGDEDDRDFVRMLLAQLEHGLCFRKRKLSMYPDDWHWLD